MGFNSGFKGLNKSYQQGTDQMTCQTEIFGSDNW